MEPTKIALRPMALHPGGDASVQLAQAEGQRVLLVRARADAALARSQRLRHWIREPLFSLPLAGAIGHLIAGLL